MNSKCLLAFLFSILMLGCSENKSQQKTINGSQFIKTLRKEAVCLTDVDSYGYKLLQEYPLKEHSDRASVVYVVDGSCSVCIAKLLKIIYIAKVVLNYTAFLLHSFCNALTGAL